MNILVTGSNGFIGKNLKLFLLEKKFNVLEFKRGDSFIKLEKLIEKSDLIFHLAGENRPKKKILFKTNNIELTNKICEIIENKNRKIKIIFTSTIKVHQKNSYSRSKLKCEKILMQLKKKINNEIKILRLPNVYGKWSKPNYNSVVATFCYNVSRNLKIKVYNDKEYIQLYYIDDLLEKFYDLIKDNDKKIFTKIEKVDRIKVKDIANKIKDFHLNINNVQLNDISPRVFKNLYSTYISFIPQKNFMFKINSHMDNRGNFVEFVKSENLGQVSCFTINKKKIEEDITITPKLNNL